MFQTEKEEYQMVLIQNTKMQLLLQFKKRFKMKYYTTSSTKCTANCPY